MKRLLSTLVLLVAAAGLCAQPRTPYIAPLGLVEGAAGVEPQAEPRTVLAVDVTVACDRTISGPYARYAQKYLGVRAPLTDKSDWRVVDARIGLAPANAFEAQQPAAPERRVVSHAASDEEFTRVAPDRRMSLMPPPADAAAAAAATIFSLRKHRLELITGEAGENVFGGGLQAALDEIAREEQALLELFLGKRIVSTKTQRFYVRPVADKRQYVVCRFNGEKGVLPANDLTGNLVVLQIDPSEQTPSSIPEASEKDPSVARCRIANEATCTLSVAGESCAEAVLPIFEFGRTITYSLPRRR